MVALAISGNSRKLNRWMREIERRDGPRAAMQMWLQLAEFALPKLGRLEHVGDEGGPVRIEVSWMASDAHEVIDVTPSDGWGGTGEGDPLRIETGEA